MSDEDEVQADSEALLDEIFDRALEAVRTGADLDLGSCLAGREDLRAEAEALVGRARALGFRPRALDPEFSGYELVRPLGRGGMGSVYLARDRKGGSVEVALKLASPDVMSNPVGRTRFLREGAVLARISHPHVVQVLEIVDEGPFCAIAMEWVRGPSLADLVAESRAGGQSAMPWERVVDLGIAMSEALDELHQLGLVHRDVKPANILLRENGSAVLADLGVVLDCEQDRLTQAGFVGTLGYAPPEQVRGLQLEVSASADLFSLGVTLYQALTRELPFATDSLRAYLESVERGPATIVAGGDSALRRLNRVFALVLHSDPRERHGSASDLRADLLRIRNGRRLPADPLRAVQRFWRTQRRRRPGITAAATTLCVLSILIAIAGYWFGVRPALARSALHAARVALLDPSMSEAYFAVERRDLLAPRTRLLSAPNRVSLKRRLLLDESIREYDRALRLMWDPLVHRERGLVRCARNRLGGGPLHSEDFLPTIGGAYDKAIAAGWDFGDPVPALLEDGFQEGLSAIEAHDLGILAHLLGDAGTAVPALERGVAAGLDDPLASAAMVTALLSTNRRLNLHEHLVVAESEFPEIASIQLQFADYYLGAGEAEQATARLQRAESLDPSTRDPWNNLTLLRGEVALMEGRLDDAYRELHWMYMHRTSSRARQALAWTEELLANWRSVHYQCLVFLRSHHERHIHKESVRQTLSRIWDAVDKDHGVGVRDRSELGRLASRATLLITRRALDWRAPSFEGPMPPPHPFWTFHGQWSRDGGPKDELRGLIENAEGSGELESEHLRLEAALLEGESLPTVLLEHVPGALTMDNLQPP